MTKNLDSETISRFFTALGDPIRLQIVTLLREKPLNVGEIASHFAISRPAVSHHLRVLKDAQILSSEKRGQEVYYAVNAEHVGDLLRGLADKLARLSGEKET